jgi:hypothetical protein
MAREAGRRAAALLLPDGAADAGAAQAAEAEAEAEAQAGGKAGQGGWKEDARPIILAEGTLEQFVQMWKYFARSQEAEDQDLAEELFEQAIEIDPERENAAWAQ